MRTVVFDLGQVILRWDPYLTQRGYLNRHEWLEFVERTDFWRVNHALDEGVDPELMKTAFASTYPDDAAIFERFIRRHTTSVTGVVSGMEAIVTALQASRVRLAALSNWSAPLFSFTAPRFEILNAFNPLIVSGEVGFAKPDPAIFTYLYERLNCAARDVIFIDDQSQNVAAAHASGADAIIFHDAARLAEALVDRGVLRPDWQRLESVEALKR